MGIFLRHSYNVKPPLWGSPADVQYAIKVNSEKIYSVDPDSIVLAAPLFWGLPPLDYSGYNNHGANHGATYKDGSLDFDGDDRIQIDNDTSLNPTSTITVTVQFKRTTTDDGRLVAKYHWAAQNDNAGYQMKIVSNNLVWEVWNNNINDNRVTSAINLSVGKKYHAVGTFDSANVRLYINSAEDANSPDAYSGSIRVETVDLAIGARYDGNSPFTGSIDEVCIAKTDRTADQIALFYDLPWALYQPVSRPIWSIPAVGGVTMPIFMSNYLRQMGA